MGGGSALLQVRAACRAAVSVACACAWEAGVPPFTPASPLTANCRVCEDVPSTAVPGMGAAEEEAAGDNVQGAKGSPRATASKPTPHTAARPARSARARGEEALENAGG